MNVHILLATYQGELYLKEQLDSLLLQTFTSWTLLISDDGSVDNTLKIIEKFAQNCTQPIEVIAGPQKGVTENFFNLIKNAPIDGNSLYAYCDQDDVWYPDKLMLAVRHYDSQCVLQLRQPYLYCGRTEIVSHSLVHLGYGCIPRKPLGFGNALIQNVAGGNTMVFSCHILKALQMINPQHSVLHDWTTYQVATGTGGVIYFDDQPCIAYRQHRANVIGAASGWVARFKRVKSALRGQHKLWADQTIKAMSEISTLLTLKSSNEVAIFERAIHSSKCGQRIKPFINKKLWLQTSLGTVVYICMLLFKVRS